MVILHVFHARGKLQTGTRAATTALSSVILYVVEGHTAHKHRKNISNKVRPLILVYLIRPRTGHTSFRLESVPRSKYEISHVIAKRHKSPLQIKLSKPPTFGTFLQLSILPQLDLQFAILNNIQHSSANQRTVRLSSQQRRLPLGRTCCSDNAAVTRLYITIFPPTERNIVKS